MDREDDIEFQQLVSGAASTATLLADAGLAFIPDDTDLDEARALVQDYAADPLQLQATATAGSIGKMTPASLILAGEILKEWSHRIVQDSMHIRHLVTNKLIVETDNPDPKVRLKAMELLGKISDVGLFSEKSEVTVTHRSTDDLRESLRAKLARLVNPTTTDAS